MENVDSLANVLSMSGHKARKELHVVKKDADLEDLVDDLDDLEDEDVEVEEDEDVEVEEDDDVLDEDDEDPDEAPKSRRKRSTSKKSAPKKEREGVGTKELAEAADVEPRVLRHYLRSAGIQPRDDRDGRYVWKSLNDPEAKRIIKAIQQGKAAQAAKKENDEVKKPARRKSTASK